MLDSFRDAFRLPDLKRRILFTLAALFVYRLGAHMPTPGVDAAALGNHEYNYGLEEAHSADSAYLHSV